MGSQKIPLFGGLIAGVDAATPNPVLLPVFTPPDSTSKAPAIYEVHLFVSPRRLNPALPVTAYGVSASDPVGAGGLVWVGRLSPDVNREPVAKALDGHPVRGAVALHFSALGTPAIVATDLTFLWGYYLRVGQGTKKQAERRPIGKTLTGFNAGVPFTIAAGASEIVHVFEKNRIDEISLAGMYLGGDVDGDVTLSLIFEDVNDVALAPPAFFRPRTARDYTDATTVGNRVILPPFGGLFPPSPYFIHQCPFGGGGSPTLHHLRVRNDVAAPGAPMSVHGYFVRN
jgi:hypothetical protein